MAISGDSVDAVDTRVSGAGGATVITPRAERALPRGTFVDRYIIVDVLGSGGMGVVYRAFDPDLDRPLAIKLVRPAVAAGLSSGGADRLLREAQALARLSHPNVVSVYDVGTYDEQVFLAMEMIDGQDLKTWLGLGGEEGEPRAWREIVRVFLEAGRGLAAAHARGLVHRDFKPRNVLIGREGRVRVVDFGLARLGEVDRRVTDTGSNRTIKLSSDLTGVGGVVGTPIYMPPEQWAGEEVDASSDQFSFCVALYQALYRRLPFEGDDDETYRTNLMAGKVREPDASLAPAWLRAAILRGLAPRREDRHPSMTQLLDAFERRLRPRRWAWVGGFSLLMGAALGATAWATASKTGVCDGIEERLVGTWDPDTKRQMHAAFTRTQLPFADSTWAHVEGSVQGWADAWASGARDACEATRVRAEQSRELHELRAQCFDTRFAQLEALVELYRGADAAVVERAVEAAESLSSLDVCSSPERLRAGVAPPTDPQLRLSVNGLRTELARAETLAGAGKEAAARELAGSLAARAEALDYAPIEGEVALFSSRVSEGPEAAEAAALDALRLAQRSGYAELEVRAWLELVRIVGYLQAKHELGLQYADHGEAVLARIGDRPDLRASLHVQRATVQDVMGRLDEAESGYRAAYELQLEINGPDHLSLTGPLNGLGIVHHMRGQDEEAIAYFEQALALRQRVLGPVHPAVASMHTNIGAVLSRASDCEAAIERYESALRILEAVRGPDHPDLSTPLNNLGVCYQNEGRYEDARRHYERALAMEVAVSGPEHPNVAGTHINLGRLARTQGEHARALEHSQRALDILLEAMGPDHLDTAFASFGVGAARLGLGDPEGAVEPLERALRVRLERDPVSENVAEAEFALARALWQTKRDRGRARELAGQARARYEALGARAAPRARAVADWLDETR